MKKFDIYVNHGVLTHEGKNVYTYGAPHPHATCSEKTEVALPENKYFSLCEKYIGDLMAESAWGWTYQINDVLQGNERPCFYALDNGMKGHRVYLEEEA